MGDPLEETTYLGPMARFDLRQELQRQVDESISQGARLLLGGKLSEGVANFFPPTVLDNVRPGMTAFDRETFGPVASLVVAADSEQAMSLANDSEFGLTAALWTSNEKAARAAAGRLDVGGVFINGYAASDPRVPIGGVKKSGYGRELSHFGVHEFLNPQTVWVNRR
jgi:succinate-semialdehyde dehydrogenase